MFYLHVCLFTICVPGACGTQKRKLDPVGLELQKAVNQHVEFWELNPEPLEVLLPAESSLQPSVVFFFFLRLLSFPISLSPSKSTHIPLLSFKLSFVYIIFGSSNTIYVSLLELHKFFVFFFF